MTAKKIFFSYSKHDRTHLDELLIFLAPLTHKGLIQTWNDHDLLAGEEWDNTIQQQLTTADIIILLVSARFLATKYIWEVEITKAMQKHNTGEAKVIPIILNHCDWTDTPFSKLNALPRKATPIADYDNKDKAWNEIVQALKKVLESNTNDTPFTNEKSNNNSLPNNHINTEGNGNIIIQNVNNSPIHINTNHHSNTPPPTSFKSGLLALLEEKQQNAIAEILIRIKDSDYMYDKVKYTEIETALNPMSLSLMANALVQSTKTLINTIK